MKFNDDPDNTVSEVRNHSIDMVTDVDQKL